ncbi:MAG: phosphoadenosine phosphosulfate reductase family protein, partial [Terriglobia bacterium]|nr:phosphoadenosine phosphosulfate reductase family protein [Terriglobia bacterium]
MMSKIFIDNPVLEDKIADARSLVAVELDTSSKACVTCSFQAEDMVVLHLVRELAPGVPVLFLETGYHFQETYEYRDRMAADWQLNLINVEPEQSVADQEAQFGILNRTAP